MRWGYLNIFLVFVLIFLWFQIDTPKITSTPVPTQTPTPTQTPPQQLIVPKLGIDSLIESVGVDTYGKMAMPEHGSQVGWYTKAVKPGEKGTAIIDGHYDDVNGNPLIFYNLKKLAIGDEIFVVDQLGNRLKFTVFEISQYPYETAVEGYYKKDDGKNLILVTCTGWWNSSFHTYSHRLVVYARM